MLYRITSSSVQEVPSTTVVDESLYEKDLENWVASRPEILGEPLLIIGRQVQMDEGKDRIDLLGLDKAGNLVVIELKRDLVGGSADIQGLRYAALVTGWKYEDIRRQAEGYWKSVGKASTTFALEVDAFCDAGYELNADQRLILAGRDIKPRLGTMAVWLRRHAVDVRVVAVSILRDEDRLYVSPQVLIPVPSEERLQAKVSVGSSDKPWLIDGQAWHLEQRCSPKGRKIVEALVDIVTRAAPDAVGPNWGQKFYISWRSGTRNWAWLNTGSNRGVLDVWAGNLTPQEAAKRVGFAVFEGEADLSTKLALGSSVGSVDEGRLLRINVKSASDIQGLEGDQLAELLSESWLSFSADLAGIAETVSVIELPDEVEPSVPVIGDV